MTWNCPAPAPGCSPVRWQALLPQAGLACRDWPKWRVLSVWRALPLLIALVHGSAAAYPLRLIADNSLAPPMAIYADADRSQLSGGIVKDFAEALAREMGLEIQIQSVPTRRTGLALSGGDADLLCFYSPTWLAEPDDPARRRFIWTSTLVTDKDVLIQRAGEPPALQLADLQGKTVGAVRGYVYPELQRMIDAGQLTRDDTHSIESNLAKLKALRLDGAIVNEVNFLHLRKLGAGEVQGLRQTMTISAFELSCAVSRRSRIAAERIEAAIARMRLRSEVRRIYARYE
jgi:ABC-type amino acid transport substrate-binding protein